MSSSTFRDFLTLGAGVTPAEGSVKPTAGFTLVAAKRSCVQSVRIFIRRGRGSPRCALAPPGAHEVICTFDERESLVARARRFEFAVQVGNENVLVAVRAYY